MHIAVKDFVTVVRHKRTPQFPFKPFNRWLCCAPFKPSETSGSGSAKRN
jgi:hypothetical protein